MLLNDAVSSAKVIYHRMARRDDHVWWVGIYLEGGDHGIVQSNILVITWSDWGRLQEISIRLVGNQTEARTGYLSNTILECYFYTYLLRKSLWIWSIPAHNHGSDSTLSWRPSDDRHFIFTAIMLWSLKSKTPYMGAAFRNIDSCLQACHADRGQDEQKPFHVAWATTTTLLSLQDDVF